MRIAFVSADATPLVRGDGTEPDDHGRRLAALASGLAAAGHTIGVFTRRHDPWAAPDKRKAAATSSSPRNCSCWPPPATRAKPATC